MDSRISVLGMAHVPFEAVMLLHVTMYEGVNHENKSYGAGAEASHGFAGGWFTSGADLGAGYSSHGLR